MKPKLNVTRPSPHGWGLGMKLCLRDWGCLGFRNERTSVIIHEEVNTMPSTIVLLSHSCDVSIECPALET